jgi:hypothetical protein
VIKKTASPDELVAAELGHDSFLPTVPGYQEAVAGFLAD